YGVAVDSKHIYWVNASGMNSIGRANLNGSDPQPDFIPNAAPVGSSPTSLAVDGSYLYWAKRVRDLRRAKVDGSGITPQLFDAGAQKARAEVAVDGAYIYFMNTSATGPGVYYASKSGQGTAGLLVGFPPVIQAGGLSLDYPYLYWGIRDATG